MRFSETPEHQAVARWLHAHPCILWIHVPGGGFRGDRQQAMRTGRYLKSLGAKAGVPDILIFSPAPRTGHVGCAVEMKSAKGAVQKSQREFMANLRACGWHTIVARSALEAVQALVDLGYDDPPRVVRPHQTAPISSSEGGGP